MVLRELGRDAELVRRPAGVSTGDITLGVVDTEQSTWNAVRKVSADAPSMVLVSTILRSPHREAVAEAGAGWLDRAGHLRVPALDIDQAIRPLEAPVPPVADLWQRPSVVGVALALLQLSGPVPTAYDLAFHAGLTHPTAGRALNDLRSLGMIDEQERPRGDLLRTQLAARWSTRWFGLVAEPMPDETSEAARLVLGVQDDLRSPGWADLAADLDVPVTLRADDSARRPRLLVPDRRALAWAMRTWGRADVRSLTRRSRSSPRRPTPSPRRSDDHLMLGSGGRVPTRWCWCSRRSFPGHRSPPRAERGGHHGSTRRC